MAAALGRPPGASKAITCRSNQLAPGRKATAEEPHSLQLRPAPPSCDGVPGQAGRRAALLGLATAAVLPQVGVGRSLAEGEEGNGWWLNGPLPVPSVTNEIANSETGTRSFLRKGIFMANIGVEGSAYRLRQYAFDLLALEDMVGQDTWSYMRRYLCLKSTVMYYDFDKVISAAAADQKQPLTDLANRLFDCVEKLEDAVKKKSLPLTESSYADTKAVLQEVRTRMT